MAKSRVEKYRTTGKRDVNTAKRRVEQRAGGGFDNYINQDIPLYKPDFGLRTVRFLPPTWEDAEHFGTDIYVHYQVGPDKQTYLCPEKMGVGRCPICDERRKAEQEGDDEYAKELRPKKRVLTYVVDRDEEDEGVRAWPMPWTLDRDIAHQTYDKRHNEILVVDDPEEGFDIDFNKVKNAGGIPNYEGIKVHRRESPLSDSEEKMEEWLEFAEDNPLPEILVFYSYDHIKSVFEGGAGASSNKADDPVDEDEDEDEKPDLSAPTDYDDEDDLPPWSTDDEDDEDEEEEKPRRRRRRSVDDDDDDDEDDEDEAPRRRRSRR